MIFMLNKTKILILLILLTSISEYKCFGDNLNMNKTILVGASIGEGWKFDELPARLGLDDQSFMYISFFEKDAIKKVQSIASEGDRVILKLCAANFRVYDSSDSDDILEKYKSAFVRWSDSFKAISVEPVLATVIPITENLPAYYKMRKLIKKYILRQDGKRVNREGTVQVLSEFNEWVREYATENKLRVLDLEKATIEGGTKKYLRADLSTDGLHLNQNGYGKLDKLAVDFFMKE